jgi:plastocyanin
MKKLASTAMGAALLLAACGGTPTPAASTAPTAAAKTAAPAASAAATAAATAAAATAPVAQVAARQIKLTAAGEQYSPAVVEVKQGEKVAFVVTNKDEAKHNMVGTGDIKLVSPDYEEGTTTTYEWTAPDKVGDFKVICAYHLATNFTLKVSPK